MLGVVSHDLRLPVNTMIATLSLLNDSVHERRGEIREWFDILLRATTQRTLVEAKDITFETDALLRKDVA